MEFMSNIGGGLQADRPSLFELIAQDKMRELLEPALRYVLAVYAQRYPRYLIRIVNRYEEFYAILMFFVERHYLREYGASFAENFYGLKRVRAPRTVKVAKVNIDDESVAASVNTAAALNASVPGSNKLRNRDIYKSLLFLIGLPYVKCKLDEYYEKVSGGEAARLFGDEFTQEEEDLTGQPLSKKAKAMTIKLFKKGYPYLNAAYQIAILVHYIGYLYNKTPFYSPWLRLIGIEVKRMSAADYREIIQKSKSAPRRTSNSLIESVQNKVLGLLSGSLDFLKVLLPMSIFFFKFLEWWYQSDYYKKSSNTGDSAEVPPPERVKPHKDGLPLPREPNVCPICVKALTNPTALSSGYVYCYPCAYKYVEDHGRCPVTLIHCRTEDLRKIYSDAEL
ncbi:ubiquitin-protein ligase peroxin 12 [Lunasporangiospora selenospora]|uniref:Peroxisome assembly protein 12 n=1 Tax=Lunasporangiospora selenospora TaxID=979761 RepID=A0A9P6FWJ9_9FUNG|nr:ubiquitin-protein ligase peroxin 12 [Lunasporangiospora selenospora]